METLHFYYEKIGQQIMRGIEKLQFLHAQILQTSSMGCLI